MSFKKRAPRAVKEIKYFAEKAMVCFLCSVLEGISKWCGKANVRVWR